MKRIEAHQVKRDNSNIRCYSDSLWRVLRKERFKRANPEGYTNQIAAEQMRQQMHEDPDFKHDVEGFCDRYLTERQAHIFALFLYGGKIRQAEIGNILGVCQATVANELKLVLRLFKEFYFPECKEEAA